MLLLTSVMALVIAVVLVLWRAQCWEERRRRAADRGRVSRY